ncbi:MAG: hypothetical protein WCX30_01745 [Candidatus Paceibacterota bacterium]|nr:hypothetical protein [bacterium]
MKKYICTNCGYQGRPTKMGKIKIIKDIIIWLSLRIIDIFYFFWKTNPKYNTCPKCKENNMLPILYINFPAYYSLYARIYTLAFLSLQKTDIEDREKQKFILKEVANIFKLTGNPTDIVLHEIEPLEELTKQLLVLLKSNDSQITSLAIEILTKINIHNNPQKENINKRIADYFSTQTSCFSKSKVV